MDRCSPAIRVAPLTLHPGAGSSRAAAGQRLVADRLGDRRLGAGAVAARLAAGLVGDQAAAGRRRRRPADASSSGTWSTWPSALVLARCSRSLDYRTLRAYAPDHLPRRPASACSPCCRRHHRSTGRTRGSCSAAGSSCSRREFTKVGAGRRHGGACWPSGVAATRPPRTPDVLLVLALAAVPLGLVHAAARPRHGHGARRSPSFGVLAAGRRAAPAGLGGLVLGAGGAGRARLRSTGVLKPTTSSRGSRRSPIRTQTRAVRLQRRRRRRSRSATAACSDAACSTARRRAASSSPSSRPTSSSRWPARSSGSSAPGVIIVLFGLLLWRALRHRRPGADLFGRLLAGGRGLLVRLPGVRRTSA